MVFTDDGTNQIRDWIARVGGTAPTHLAVGDDNTAETKGDIELGNELDRFVFDIVSTSNKQIIFEQTVLSTQLNGEELNEFGIFNDPVAGKMFTRATHAKINKTDSIEVQYKVRVRLKN